LINGRQRAARIIGAAHFFKEKTMTINDILTQVDEIQPNTYDENIKIAWLSELDGRIFNDVILTHEHDLVEDEEGNLVEPEFVAYDENSENEELIIPNTYADIYRHWLFAQIAYSNGEVDRFNNSMVMYNSSLKEYYDWYNRNNLPIQKPLKVF
jgi:hypothetical protein